MEKIGKTAKKTALPSLKILFKDSWELFKKTILLYGKLLIAGFVAIGIFLFLTLISGGFLVKAVIEAARYPTVYEIITVILLAVVTLIPLIGLVASTLLFSIADTIALTNPQKTSIRSMVQASRPLIAPYFITAFLNAFLVAGGYLVLLLPGVVMSILLLFALYEVVFEKQSGIAALKRSYILVKGHFWSVVGRYVLIEVITMVLSNLLPRIVGKDGLLLVVIFLINLAVGWFIQVYMYVVYKQVKATAKTDSSSSTTWMWVLAVIGWVLLVVSAIFFGNAVMYFFQSNPFKNIPSGTV